MPPSSGGHEFNNIEISGQAEVMMGDVYKSIYVYCNNCSHHSTSQNASMSKDEEIDSEFRDFTMLGANFVEERARSMLSLGEDSLLPNLDGITEATKAQQMQTQATFTSSPNLASSSVLAEISGLQTSSRSPSLPMENLLGSASDANTHKVRSDLAMIRREISELRDSVRDSIAQQQVLNGTPQYQQQPASIRRIFSSLISFVQVQGQLQPEEPKRDCSQEINDTNTEALVNHFLHSALGLATCFLFRVVAKPEDLRSEMLRLREDCIFAMMLPCLGWSLTRLMRTLPRHIPWLQGNNILLEDALGVLIEVPLVFCRSSQIFHGFLETHFENKPGLKKVQARHYNLMLGGREGDVILEGSRGWRCGQIKASSKIVMAIYFSSSTVLCFECQTALAPRNENAYWCASCGRIYRAHHEEVFQAEVTSNTSSTTSGTGVFTGDHQSGRSSSNRDDLEAQRLLSELALIRNLDLVLPPQAEDEHDSIPPAEPFQASIDLSLIEKMASSVYGAMESEVHKLPRNTGPEKIVAAMTVDIVAAARKRVIRVMEQTREFGVDFRDPGLSQIQRETMMLDLQMQMRKLSTAQQTMSNVLNNMHENAMDPIRNIKA